MGRTPWRAVALKPRVVDVFVGDVLAAAPCAAAVERDDRRAANEAGRDRPLQPDGDTRGHVQWQRGEPLECVRSVRQVPPCGGGRVTARA